MPSPRVLEHVFLALALVLPLGAAGSVPLPPPAAEQSAAPSQAAEQPNVLLITVDDLRPTLSAYGSGESNASDGGLPPPPTPHVDQLAEEGTLFERAFAHYAVCAPSRANLLTGLRPDSLDMWINQIPVRELVPGVVTLPQHFKQNGYRTLSVGFKVFHNPDPRSWSERIPVDISGDAPPAAADGPRGPGRYYAASSIEAARQPGGGFGRGPTYEHPEVPDTAYTDGQTAARAVEALGRLGDGPNEEPFFMALGFLRPHLPFNCPDRYWEAAGEETQKLPDNYFPPENATPFSLSNVGELRSYAGIPDEGPVPEETGRALNRAYRACVSYVDAQIGRVMDELRAQGMAENTIVVFWGDHGFKLGEHESWSKHTDYEIDTRIPLIVRAPAAATRAAGLPQQAGGRTDALVETVDIFSTLTELAGLPPPQQHQGTSFAPLLSNPGQAWKEAAFMQYGRGSGQDIDVMGRAVRTDRYRYVEWQREPGQPDGRVEPGGEVLARELYDHRSDPAENVNVAGRAAYAETVERLSETLREGWKAARPERPNPEPEPSVELSAFSAAPDGAGAALLTWSTRVEQGTRGFELQRERFGDGDEWEKIAFVESKSGDASSGEGFDYRHRVEDVPYGRHTFRLVQIDRLYREQPLAKRASVKLDMEGDIEISEVYPNPIRSGAGGSEARLDVTVRETQPVTVALYDASGRRVRVLRDGALAGQRTEAVHVAAAGLSSGVYFVRVRGDSFTETRRLVIVQ